MRPAVSPTVNRSPARTSRSKGAPQLHRTELAGRRSSSTAGLEVIGLRRARPDPRAGGLRYVGRPPAAGGGVGAREEVHVATPRRSSSVGGAAYRDEACTT